MFRRERFRSDVFALGIAKKHLSLLYKSSLYFTNILFTMYTTNHLQTWPVPDTSVQTQCAQILIDRSSAGGIRLMGAVASGHGNVIRGTSRSEKPGQKINKSYIPPGVSHRDRPRTKHHRSRHDSTGVTDDILTAQPPQHIHPNECSHFPIGTVLQHSYVNHTSVDYINILLIRQTASTRSPVPLACMRVSVAVHISETFFPT